MIGWLKRNKVVVGLVGLLGLALLVILFINLTDSQTAQVTFVDVAFPQIGVAVDQNRVVADVLPGSPAEKAGIAQGDLLKQVGNTILTSSGSLHEAFQKEISAIITPKEVPNEIGNIEVGDLPLVISRGGQDLSLLVKPASPPFVRPPGNQMLPTATAVPASSDWIYI